MYGLEIKYDGSNLLGTVWLYVSIGQELESHRNDHQDLGSPTSLLWRHLSRSVYSEKKYGLDDLQHHITAACVAAN